MGAGDPVEVGSHAEKKGSRRRWKRGRNIKIDATIECREYGAGLYEEKMMGHSYRKDYLAGYFMQLFFFFFFFS
jgi:hypothetical protein